MKRRTQPIRTLKAGLVFGGLFISLSALFAAPKLSTGVAKGVASEWQKVTLPKSYKSMVVIATPNYSKKSVPIVARVRNAKGKSFELMAQNPKGKSVKAVDVYYMVVEEGVYSKKKDGVTMEAVKVSIKSTNRSGSWKGQKQSYKNKYKKPVVLGQVMSANDKIGLFFGPATAAQALTRLINWQWANTWPKIKTPSVRPKPLVMS
jgi:hypothetical protein